MKGSFFSVFLLLSVSIYQSESQYAEEFATAARALPYVVNAIKSLHSHFMGKRSITEITTLVKNQSKYTFKLVHQYCNTDEAPELPMSVIKPDSTEVFVAVNYGSLLQAKGCIVKYRAEEDDGVSFEAVVENSFLLPIKGEGVTLNSFPENEYVNFIIEDKQ